MKKTTENQETESKYVELVIKFLTYNEILYEMKARHRRLGKFS